MYTIKYLNEITHKQTITEATDLYFFLKSLLTPKARVNVYDPLGQLILGRE